MDFTYLSDASFVASHAGHFVGHHDGRCAMGVESRTAKVETEKREFAKELCEGIPRIE